MCPRHCEGNSDKAIEILARAIWIASLALAMTQPAPFSRRVSVLKR
jgi:hypothetical protein